jgi:carbonic anhydrase
MCFKTKRMFKTDTDLSLSNEGTGLYNGCQARPPDRGKSSLCVALTLDHRHDFKGKRNKMMNRRQLLKSLPAAAAAGALFAVSGHTLAADIPAMSKESQRNMTPEQALGRLKDGNERFISGKMLQRDLMAQVRATASGQYPFAVVLGCIDSRVPPELVFDQGIGDIFSARIAGNFASTDLVGSIEFATKLAGAKLVVVLGHTECGAIKGACDNVQLGSLTQTLSNIAPAVYAVKEICENRTSKNKTFVQKVADENVRLTVQALTERSAVLRDLVDGIRLKLIGAMHHVATGRVSFFE